MGIYISDRDADALKTGLMVYIGIHVFALAACVVGCTASISSDNNDAAAKTEKTQLATAFKANASTLTLNGLQYNVVSQKDGACTIVEAQRPSVTARSNHSFPNATPLIEATVTLCPAKGPQG